jgi:hypothetical protein
VNQNTDEIQVKRRVWRMSHLREITGWLMQLWASTSSFLLGAWAWGFTREFMDISPYISWSLWGAGCALAIYLWPARLNLSR